MAEPALRTERPTVATQLAEQAARATAQDRPYFVVVFYRDEGEKLEFLEAVRHELRGRALHSRTYDPAHRPEHRTGKLYGLLTQGAADTIHLVADLARGEDCGFDRAFLNYLNLHRDTINRERLRLVLFVHESEAEAFLRAAGDLWEFRQRTIWLERPAEPRGEGLWQEVLERSARLPKPDVERQEIEHHVADVRAQADSTTDPGERAGLLLDLVRWLLRHGAAAAAEEVAREGLHLAPEENRSLHLRLELVQAEALRRQAQNPEALRHLERALALSREIGDRKAEATTLNNISQIYHAWGRYEGALDHLQQSLQLQREIGDRPSEAVTLNNISQIYHAWGRDDDALDHLQQSLHISRKIGDRAGEAVALSNVSSIYHARRRYDEALDHLKQGLQLQREIGDRAGEAITLNNISQIYHAWGRYDEALDHLQQSLGIRREIGDRAGEAVTLNNISQVYDAWGRYDAALDHLQQSLRIRREIGDRAGEAVTLWNLGREYERRGNLEGAAKCLRAAVEIREELKHPRVTAEREYLAKVEDRLRQQASAAR